MTIERDADLDRFAQVLDRRRGDPAGRLRFTLGGGAPRAPGALRVEPRRGRPSARSTRRRRPAQRLVLGPRAVLTPLAREKARALGIEIEREW